MHDASHSEAIISKMEMLLGDRIERLSPTDTWLLLHAAYTHDLGMILTWDDVKKLGNRPNFRTLLQPYPSLETAICAVRRNMFPLGRHMMTISPGHWICTALLG